MKNIAEIAIKNAARTMKNRAKQEETPTRVGDAVLLSVWLAEYLKVAEGKSETAAQEHLRTAEKSEIKDGDRIVGLETSDVVAVIDIAKLKIDEKPYDMEFVKLTAKTAMGRLILCNGVDDLTLEKDEKTGEESEVPSVTRYFNTAFSQNSRNAASARMRGIVEGPDKAVASAAKKLAGVWGVTQEEAEKRIRAMQA